MIAPINRKWKLPGIGAFEGIGHYRNEKTCSTGGGVSLSKETIADFKLDSTARRPCLVAICRSVKAMRLIRTLMALARIRLGCWLIQLGAMLIEAGTWLIKL
jgi:hypothetical protein